MSSDFSESNSSEPISDAPISDAPISDHDRWRPLAQQGAPLTNSIEHFMAPDPVISVNPLIVPELKEVAQLEGVLIDQPVPDETFVPPLPTTDIFVPPAVTVSPTPSSTWGTVAPSIPSNASLGASRPEPKRSWAKPALVGGLIGSLLSGAVSVGAVLATRSKDPQTVSQTKVPAIAASKSLAIPNASSPAVFSEETNSLKAAFRAVAPSVVSIQTRGLVPGRFSGVEPSEGAGSGVILSEDGLVLTNAHVIEQATSIKVTLADRSVRDATLVGFDTTNDIALVRITNAKGLPAATLGQSGNIEVGDQVVAIGNALALEGGPTVTTGIVSALDRDISDESTTLRGLIQTDAAINPGNSGGPLVNIAGEVVGMNTAIIQNSNSIGFAIPVDRIRPMLEELKSAKPRTFIGVSTITLDEETRVAYDIKATEGAVVVAIVNGSPAENVGLLPGDVIVSFDGKPVEESQTLVDLVRAKKPDDSVKIVWKRGTLEKTGTIKLGSALRVGK